MSFSSLNINNQRNIDYTTQMYKSSNTNTNTISNSNTIYSNNSKQSIPKSQPTIKRCNSKPNFSNSEAKYDLFSTSATDNQQIEFLKKSFKTRIVQLISNLQSCVSKLTPYNASDLINEQIFLEKETAIALLYEEMSLIKVEYEENKGEMDRLQKIISVLEIDLNKFDSKLNEMTQKSQALQNDNSRLQAENFDYSLQVKTLNTKLSKSSSAAMSDNSEALNTISVLKENYNQMYNELHETIVQVKQEGDNHVALMQKEYQKKTNDLEHELFKLKNTVNDNKDTIQKKNTEINRLSSDKEALTISLEATKKMIPMLSTQIERMKEEYKRMVHDTKGEMETYRSDIRDITERIMTALTLNEVIDEDNSRVALVEERNEKLLLENYRLNDQNQKLNDCNKKYILQINTMTNKLSNSENDVKAANNTIAKLKIEIDALNDALNNKKLILHNYKNSAQISYDDMKNSIKAKIKVIKAKYIEEITKLRYAVNALLKNNNELIDDEVNEKDKEKETHNTVQLIEYEKTITTFKQNISSYERALIKKEKKIKELKSALSQSFHSLSSGMNNIKIAHLLDNEVKQLMSKEKNQTKKHK